MHRFSCCLLGAALALSAAVVHGVPNSVNSAESPARLVIIGASYARGWQQPDLPGYEVVNKGVSGEETHQVLARFERDVVSVRPSAVLIWGHINNIHRAPGGDFERARQRAQADYLAMIAAARKHGIDVVLATEVTLSEAVGWTNRLAAFIGRLRGKQGYSARINEHVRALNSWLRTYAQQERIPLLDFERAFDDGEGFRKLEYSSEDGTHISAAGYAALTRYARSHLELR